MDGENTLLTTNVEKLNLHELQPILPIHYKELSEHLKHSIPLNPDYPKYLLRENAGELLYVTLRKQGQLIGYFVGFFCPGLHYKDCNTLSLDIFYVTPEARGLGGGQLLLNQVKREFTRRHGHLWVMGCKEEHRIFMEKLLLSMGFEPFERLYAFWPKTA